jgi:hypothetical protein
MPRVIYILEELEQTGIDVYDFSVKFTPFKYLNKERFAS